MSLYSRESFDRLGHAVVAQDENLDGGNPLGGGVGGPPRGRFLGGLDHVETGRRKAISRECE